MIGLVKKDYCDCAVYITPRMTEINELIESGCEIIAMDQSLSTRPRKSQRKS